MKGFYAVVLAASLYYPLDLFAQSPVGIWTDKDKNTFELYGSGTISGKIRSLNPPTTPAGKTLTDIHNPDPSKRGVPLIGFVFLRDFKPTGKDFWSEGTIYDPKSGKTYSCTLQMNGDDSLIVHGFIGVSVFGRTEHWKRVVASASAAPNGGRGGSPSRP